MILTGYFYKDPEKFKTEGLFRITSSGSKMRILETHLRAGNFAFLKTLGDNNVNNNVVTNMIKRVLRNSRTPLIPYQLYGEFL